MDIQLAPDAARPLLASIQRFVAEEYGESIGELKAEAFLRVCLQEIGPAVYNRAIADAQACLQERVTDLENICFAEEGGYWKRPGRPQVARKPAGR